jgi:2-oxoglutarate dehydrogenase E2 component (dihydrolipoamide succinyltransferase)
MALELKVPAVGESITEVEIGDWLVEVGAWVAEDEPVVVIESDKASMELPAPAGAVLTEILKKTGETAAVGEVIGRMEKAVKPPAEGEKKGTAEDATEGTAKAPEAPAATVDKKADPAKKPEAAKKAEAAPAEQPEPRVMPAARRALADAGLEASQVPASGPGGRLLKEDVEKARSEASKAEGKEAPAAASAPAASPKAEAPAPPRPAGAREEEVVRMTSLRRRIAERLVSAQQTAALLTTFNEADMSAIMALRSQYKDTFQQRYGIKLGFMSFFVKAVIEALKQVPALNAEIRETNVVYRNYYDIGVAVGGGKGLVVPVIRNAERLSFAEVELTIADLAKRARDNALSLEELQGGTFTISNGGIYGSMLSTPIINPPQSGILGMHNILERPVAENGQVVIRPMMYLALTYDHRIVDGREAVTFLVRVKDCIEQPARMLLEI